MATSSRTKVSPRPLVRASSAASDGSRSTSAASADLLPRGTIGMGKKFTVNGRRVLDYEAGREWVWQNLHLSNEDEWQDWTLNSRRGLPFIPRDPAAAYAEHGWTSWDEWLGVPLPFEDARAYARSLAGPYTSPLLSSTKFTFLWDKLAR